MSIAAFALLQQLAVSDPAVHAGAGDSTGDVPDHRIPVHVSYHVTSTAARDSSRTTITVTDITNPLKGKRVLQVSFGGALVKGVTDFDRELDFSRLKAGRYRLEVQVADLRGGGVMVRPVEFRLR